MTVLVSTHLLSINPAGFARYEIESDEILENYVDEKREIDWVATDLSDGYTICAKKVFNWMKDDLNLFKGISRTIKGFKIQFDGWFNHGYTGNNIEMKVSYSSNENLRQIIARFGKRKEFKDFLIANYSSYDGFHSFIPNTPDGLIEQNDPTYMMSVILGFILNKRIEKIGLIDNVYTEPAPFDCNHVCPELMDFTGTDEAYDLLKFKN